MAGKRERSRHAGGLIIVHIVAVVMILIAGFWASTQWIASVLNYQPELGPPWFSVLEWHVYKPWQYFAWSYNYQAYAHNEFAKAMIPSFIGAFLSVGAAIGISVWRARLVDSATTYGSARWANGDDLEKSGLVKGEGGVVLGVTDDGRYITHDGPEHIKVIAPSRSGKGVGIVIPTLLTWPASVVVNDIKRELWDETAGWRSTFSNCIAFDASNPATARFNPLFEVRRGPHEVKDVQNLTDMIVDPEGKGKPDHWSKEGDAYLVAVVLHVLYVEEDKTLEGVTAFLSNPSRSLDETLHYMLNTRHLGDRPHPVVAMGARGMLNKSENEKSGVHSTAKSFFSLFLDPIVANATRESDFRVADLMKAEYPVSLYLISPPSDKKRLKPLFRLILSQICTRLTEEHNPKDNKHRLLMLIDEFPSLGKIDFFEDSLAYVAGYGMKVMMISSTLSDSLTF
jgi:type IV secretion system protein VirD4